MTNIDIHRYDAKLQSDGSYMFPDGAQRWYNEWGQYHREDGPAIIYKNNHSLWFNHGEPLSFNNWLKQSKTTDKQKLLLRLQYE